MDVITHEGARYLVAAYGVVNWVHNVRASGEAVLTRGHHSQVVKLAELVPEEAVPILRKYFETIRVTRPYFDFNHNSPDEDVLRDVPGHPAFRIVEGRAEVGR